LDTECKTEGLLGNFNECLPITTGKLSYIVEPETDTYCFKLYDTKLQLLSQQNIVCGQLDPVQLDCHLDQYYYLSEGPFSYSVYNAFKDGYTVVDPLPCIK
jgi:hypothetical protein